MLLISLRTGKEGRANAMWGDVVVGDCWATEKLVTLGEEKLVTRRRS